MKFCPQCNLEFEDETVFCPRDGSQLQARAVRAGVMKLGSRPTSAGTLGSGALTATPAGDDPGDATRQVPSMATLQAATVRAPPRSTGAAKVRGPSPARGSPATFQKTIQSSAAMQQAALAAHAFVEDVDATSRVMLPDLGPVTARRSPTDGELLDTPTVAMATSPVAPPIAQRPEAAPHDVDGDVDMSGRSVAGRYKLLKKLGEGGMGVVYAAVDERIDKQIAIKILREEFARRPDVVARFTQEARSAGRIKHENVLDVTDYGRTEDGSFYIAMELLVGTDLADVLQKEKTLAPERGIDIAIQICRALAAAHREGVVHRDLKPENVFLVRSADGREVAKIVDFGIAQLKDGVEGGRKLTRTGMIFGTPEYMSPEQAAGKSIDNRVDVYATGIILFEVFAGRVPFVGDTFMGVLTQHMFEPVPPLRQVNPETVANEDLEAVISKTLAKDPAQRYATMTELAEDLLRVRNGLRPNAPAGYDGTGTFLRSQMLAGAGLTPGAIQPSKPGGSSYGAPTGGGVARTIEHELPPPGRKTALLVGIGIGVLVVGAVAIALMSGGDPPQPARQPDPPVATPPHVPEAPPARPPPVPAVVVDAGAAPPRTLRVSVSTPGATAEVSVLGETGAPRCPATPCTLELPRGAAVTLVATSGARRGSVVVTPTAEGQPVAIALPPERTDRPDRGDRNGHGRTPPTPSPMVGPVPTPPSPPPPSGPVDRHGGACIGSDDCNCIRPGTGLLLPCDL